MITTSQLYDPVLKWINIRQHRLNADPGYCWVANDPIVGHLSGALWKMYTTGLVNLLDQAKNELSQRYFSNQARWVLWQSQIEQVLTEFQLNGIPFIPLKGLALQFELYADWGIRPMGDIDILIHPNNFVYSAKILQNLGFNLHSSSQLLSLDQLKNSLLDFPNELIFQNDKGLIVEIHQHLVPASWWEPVYTIDVQSVWEHARKAATGNLNDRSISFLSIEDTLAYLCFHLGWHGLQPLMGYLDVDLLIRDKCLELDWALFAQTAHSWGIRCIVYTVLKICQFYMATPVPINLFDLLELDKLHQLWSQLLINRNNLDNGFRSSNPQLFRVLTFESPGQFLRLLHQKHFSPLHWGKL